MPKQKDLSKLTDREMDVLNIMWDIGKPMTASEIAKTEDSLTINTVRAALKNLQHKQLIEVAEITYSGTVLCRSYRPALNPSEFFARTFHNYIRDNRKNISAAEIISALLDSRETDETLINNLEKVLAKQKKRLEND
jgi:predicted transcriptional regulator